MSDSLTKELVSVGVSARIIRGHRVERLYQDRWIVDGDDLDFDAAMARISAADGDNDPIEGTIGALLDIEKP